MTQRKTLEGRAASWHPHPKDAAARSSNPSLVPVVRSATDEIEHPFFDDGGAEPADHDASRTTAATGHAAPAADAGLDQAADHDDHPDDLEDDEAPASVARSRALASAPVRARRRYLMRYVAGAVGAAGLIGVAALVRMTGAPDARASQERDRPTTAAAGTLEGTSARATEPEAKVAEATPTPAAPSASPTPSATEAAAAPAAPATDDTAAQVPDPAPAPDPAAAREAKRQAQHAIDRNQLAVAIEAGERSVALDPTDAEAWLILGAAYQSKGGYAEARRCFSSCMHEATRGPRSECGALLR